MFSLGGTVFFFYRFGHFIDFFFSVNMSASIQSASCSSFSRVGGLFQHTIYKLDVRANTAETSVRFLSKSGTLVL